MGQLFSLLLLVGFVLHSFWWIAARADQQHRWVMAGDPRGTYGAEITVPTEGNRTAAQRV